MSRFSATMSIYRPNWFHPRSVEWVKVTYLLSQKPVSRVIGKTIQRLAICGVMTCSNEKMGKCSNDKTTFYIFVADNKVIHQKVQYPIEHHISSTAHSVTKHLFRQQFSERTIEKINDFCNYLR